MAKRSNATKVAKIIEAWLLTSLTVNNFTAQLKLKSALQVILEL